MVGQQNRHPSSSAYPQKFSFKKGGGAGPGGKLADKANLKKTTIKQK